MKKLLSRSISTVTNVKKETILLKKTKHWKLIRFIRINLLDVSSMLLILTYSRIYIANNYDDNSKNVLDDIGENTEKYIF